MHTPLRRQRLKLSNACHGCRVRKVKCDGSRPACARYQGRDKPSTHDTNSPHGGRGTIRNPRSLNHGRVPPLASPPASRAHSLATSTTTTPRGSGNSLGLQDVGNSEDSDHEQSRAHYNAHGRFAGEVAAAIDTRAGLPPAASHPIPFVDAPLFGDVDLQSPYSDSNFASELPPQAHADKLVAIYWEFVDPIESVLDQEIFTYNYEASYSGCGSSISGCQDVWFSILNTVFALAVQRQESISLRRRNEEATRYFQRAWALLPPDMILWQAGSIELVQCLMLINRYLHCTNNQQKTWMTAGLAMRIAQNMCYHVPQSSLTNELFKEKQMKEKVWASLVGLDRCVSWSLGRISAPPPISLPNCAPSPVSNSHSHEARQQTQLHTRLLELFEIGNQIQLAQAQTRNGLVAKLGLPRLYQQDEYHSIAVQFDNCLRKWEDGLPGDLQVQNLGTGGNRASRVRHYLLHLHLLHTRIFLYRPLLARFYSQTSPMTATQTTAETSNLSNRLLKECAKMCIEAAQNVTSLIIQTLERDEPIGLLPWWYRIYYLHIAGTNFLAAMLTSDLFTESASQSWQDVLSALRKHEHLTGYVAQCLQTFERCSQRILESQKLRPGDSSNIPLDEPPSLYFDDIFHDTDFDFNSFLFGIEDNISPSF